MACIIATAVEAVVVTIAEKAISSKEHKEAGLMAATGHIPVQSCVKIPLSRKLRWLSTMLWGGNFLLAFEHVWHGEIVPWFPFLTAVENPQDIPTMLYEIATVGCGMAVLVTMVWLGIILIAEKSLKRNFKYQGQIKGAEGML